MENLSIVNENGVLVADSRDIAQMICKQHDQLMRSIRTYIDYMNSAKLQTDKFFISSTYRDINNQERPCYLLTKRGCDMVANKMTGEKGVLFTAAYVTRFEEMEKVISKVENIEHFKKDQLQLEFSMNILRVNDGSKVKMLKKFNEVHHLTTDYLPDYTEEKITKSLTALIKEHDVKLSTIKINSILIGLEILEEKQRPSQGKGIKKYKSLTELGLKYGKNLISTRGNQIETQPHYYEDTFEDLISLVLNNVERKCS